MYINIKKKYLSIFRIMYSIIFIYNFNVEFNNNNNNNIKILKEGK